MTTLLIVLTIYSIYIIQSLRVHPENQAEPSFTGSKIQVSFATDPRKQKNNAW